MITYIKMKYKEWRLKLAFYNAVESVAKEQENIIQLVKNLYVAIKDTPIDELQDKVITEICRLAHEQATKERREENTEEE